MPRPPSLPMSLPQCPRPPLISYSRAVRKYTTTLLRQRLNLSSAHRHQTYHPPHIHSRHQSRSKSTIRPPKPHLPLAGLRILDLSRVLAGPFCTQILADYGADVIKIEQPGSGDETRVWRADGETAQMWRDGDVPDADIDANLTDEERQQQQHQYQLMSLYFASVNRNKRSVTIDLKSDAGKAIIRKFVSDWPVPSSSVDPANTPGADVVVHNFLPGKIEAMGLGYDVVSSWNPRVVYASVSGYGTSGPMRTRAGYDAIALAESGLLHITGETHPDATPVKPGVAIGDLCTGLYLHGAILAALQDRLRTGHGGVVEGSLLESSLSLLINVGLGAVNLDLNPSQRRRGRKLGLGHASLVPYGGYQTRDKRWFFVAANNNRQWQGFCRTLGVAAIAEDERFKSNDGRVENRAEIDGRLNEVFGRKTLQEWKDIFEGSGLPYGAVNDVVEALEGEQSGDRKMVREITDMKAAKGGMLKVLGNPVKFGNHAAKSETGSSNGPDGVSEKETAKVDAEITLSKDEIAQSDEGNLQSEKKTKAGIPRIGDIRINPPLLGEHTDQVLEEVLGVGRGERARLKDEGVI